MQNKQHALVALGANLPFGGMTPETTIRSAAVALSAQGLRVTALSRLFKTPCFPPGAGPDYVNAACVLTCPDGMPPHAILDALHSVEARFGRAREKRWGMRTLDLDLLATGELVLPSPAVQSQWRDLLPEQQAVRAPDELILPHPRLQDRAFVLVPLADVAPDWRHPVLGQTVRHMLARLPERDRAEVTPIG
ncbi:MAG: 2-amino-4-hydroxy-6-hydroxymethyldihydropteridine diphosphokinase [Rhodobacteraceae bacterium]|nr:2-amino-4-hydroxy-6-hydroxymethyldihydropteridine diphosphokinase [Paracoccaceae bacterium]